MLIKVHFGALNKPLFQTVTFFHLEAARSSSCCGVSRVVKGHMALSYDTSIGVTLAPRENSASKKLQGLVVLTLRDSLRHSTLRVLVS